MDGLNVYIKCIHKYISHIPYLGPLYRKGAQLVFKFKKKTLNPKYSRTMDTKRKSTEIADLFSTKSQFNHRPLKWRWTWIN